MTNIINKINIKIHEKKTKKRKYKKRNVRTQQNAPYTSVASLITNRPQQLDLSTASNREQENIISNAINNVKREKEILTIKDKQPVFESPKPLPTQLQPTKKITDFFAKTPEKNLYDTYPKEKTVHYDRVEELGAVNKKGRKMAPQKPTESTDDYINRLKKSRSFTMQSMPIPKRDKEFTTPNKPDVIPAPTENKFIKKVLQSVSESKKSLAQSKKNMKLEEKFNNKVMNVINSPESIHKLKNEHDVETERAARARKREDKSNQAITDLFNSNQFL
jgi:hypothetical protein